MNTLITAAKIKDYEPIWATIFAKALKFYLAATV